MARTLGPSADGKTYIFPADKITWENMEFRESVRKVGKYIKGQYGTGKYELPYETPEQKEVVNKLNLEWKRLFQSTHKMGFVGDQAKNWKFFERLGANRILAPNPEPAVGDSAKDWDTTYGWVFEDDKISEKSGLSPAADRYALAKALLGQSKEDLEILHEISPYSSIYKPTGTMNDDENAEFVRNELKRMGAAEVKRGNSVGFVFPPTGRFNANDPDEVQEWLQYIDTAENMIMEAAYAKGPLAEKSTQIIGFILAHDQLSMAAFKEKGLTFPQIEGMKRKEQYKAIRAATEEYSRLVAEHEALDKAYQADNYGPVTAEMVDKAEKALIQGANGKIVKTLAEAAVQSMGVEKVEATLSDVQDLKNEEKLDAIVHGVKESTGGYAKNEKDKAVADMLGFNDVDMVRTIAQLRESIGGEDIEVINPIKPFVANGPIVGFNKDYIFQVALFTRGGIENIQKMKHPRIEFLNAQYTEENAPVFTKQELETEVQKAGKNGRKFKQEQLDMHASAMSEFKGSVLVSNIYSYNGNDAVLQKIVDSKKPVTIGKHAGVLIALQESKLANRTVDSIKYNELDDIPKQNLLVDLITRETIYANNKSKSYGTQLGNALKEIEKYNAKVPANASIDVVAKAKQEKDRIQKELKELEEKVMPVIAEMHEEAVTRALESSKEEQNDKSAGVEVRSKQATNTPNLPPPVREATFPEAPKPIHGIISEFRKLNKSEDAVLLFQSWDVENNQLSKPNGHKLFRFDSTQPSLTTAAIYSAKDKWENGVVGTYAKRENGELWKAYPVTIGLVNDGSGFTKIGMRRGIWPSQAALDQEYQRSLSQADIKDNNVSYTTTKTRDAGVYDTSVNKANAAHNSDIEQGMRTAIDDQINYLASNLKIDRNRITVQYRDVKNGVEDSGYLKNPNVSHPHYQRDGMLVKDAAAVLQSAREMQVYYVSKQDPLHHKQNYGLVLLADYNSDTNKADVVVLEYYATTKVNMANSEQLTDGKGVASRTLKVGDTVSIAVDGTDEIGKPIHQIEIIDEKVKRQIEKRNEIKNVADQRVNKTAFGELELRLYRDMFIEKGYKYIKAVESVDMSNFDGNKTGELVAMERNGRKWAALVLNPESYEKQGGKFEIVTLHDPEIVSLAFSKDGRGKPYSGTKYNVFFSTDSKTKPHAKAVEEVVELNLDEADNEIIVEQENTVQAGKPTGRK